MKREVKIGIFAIVILLCFWAAIRFLSGIDIFSRNMIYHATYANVSGLQAAAPITINGVKVGTVETIDLKDSTVVIDIAINRKYRIPKDSKAKIYSDGVLGNKAVAIELGSSAQMLQKGDTIASAVNRDLMDVAGSELEFFKQKLSTITEDLSVTLRNLNSLIENNSDDFSATMSHLNSISASLDQVLTREKTDLVSIVNSLEQLARTLSDNSQHLENIMVNADSFSQQLEAARIDSLAASFNRTATQLSTMLEQVNSGQGSLGKLLTDQALYDNLTAASQNLSLLLEDLKAHPKRYVHFSVFGRKDKPEKSTVQDSTATAEK